jgi:ribose transport system permease protein
MHPRQNDCRWDDLRLHQRIRFELLGVRLFIGIARLTIASPIRGIGFEPHAIAAVIIGGTSLNGGSGSLIGTFLGACLIGVLADGLIAERAQ